MPFRKAADIVDSVRRAIAAKNWPPEGHVLSVRSFARQWDVSHKTAHRVLRALRDLKLLAQDERTGSYTVPGAPPPPHLPGEGRHKTSLYNDIATVLRREIVEGVQKPGIPLPDMKTLGARFQCSYPTVRSALQRLAEQRIITRRGKQFVASVPRLQGTPNRSRIFFVGDPDLFTRYHSHIPLMIGGAQRATEMLGWLQGLDFFLTSKPGITKSPPDHQIAGFIYFKDDQFEHWKDYFIQRRNIPLVMIDPAELLRASIRFRAYHGRSFTLSSSNREAGYSIGEFLSGQGMHHVAFFTHEALGRGWARLRWEGLVDALQGKGMVRLFSISSRHVQDARHANLSMQLSELTRELVDARMTPAMVARHAAAPLNHLIDFGEFQSGALQAFAEALSDRSISAWVCVNDDLATAARTFLSSSKTKTRAIHLAGFDNSPASLALGFTSYDFNFDRMGHLAVECLTRPENVPFNEDCVVRVEGKLIVRGQ